MYRVLIGFCIGVGALLVVFEILARHDDLSPSVAAEGGDRDLDSSIAPASQAEANRQSAAERASELNPPSTVLISNEATAANAAPTVDELVRLREKADSAESAWQRAEYEFNLALAAAPVENPVDLPAEFGWLSDRDGIAHAFFERESVDPDWAPTTEAQLLSFVSKRPDLIERYGYPTVRCRTTRCEVQFVSHAAGETQSETIMRWSSISANIFEEDWSDQFRSDAQFGHPANTTWDVNEQDGVTTILWHIWKTSD